MEKGNSAFPLKFNKNKTLNAHKILKISDLRVNQSNSIDNFS